MKTTIVTAIYGLIVTVATYFMQPATAHAWSIAVDCFPNTLGTPGKPTANVDCFYAWTADSNILNNNGSWVSTLSLDSSGVKLHELSQAKFGLSSRTSPDHVWIGCANQTGTHRVDMDGYLWRPTTPSPGVPPGWALVSSDLEVEFAFITTPLVLCP
jgi:hypothetical protein